MGIHDLIYQASAGKRRRAREELTRRWAAGICVATTAASLGVVTGILIAPKSGKETRADLRRKAKKSVDSMEEAILDKAEDK